MAAGLLFNATTRLAVAAGKGGYRAGARSGAKAGWQKVGKLTSDGKVKISSTGRVVDKSYASRLGNNPSLLKKHKDAAKKTDLSSTSKGRRNINKARKSTDYSKSERRQLTKTLKKTQKEARKAGPAKRKAFNKAVAKNPKKFDAQAALNKSSNAPKKVTLAKGDTAKSLQLQRNSATAEFDRADGAVERAQRAFAKNGSRANEQALFRAIDDRSKASSSLEEIIAKQKKLSSQKSREAAAKKIAASKGSPAKKPARRKR